ncbi:beta-CASP ribonuclease aCPSF1 [Candidatus Pacearchaeota archaeon]|nr:MAG: beta-CASP ribonuclease aCPSF1 [Candidatus Pacearchaeota archaeon]
MADILKTIENQLPQGVVASTIFEGANIVIYTSDRDFLREGDAAVKEVVNSIKKRIELRADKSILLSQEETEKKIREIIPQEADLTKIIFDPQRSVVVIETKKPGLAIGKAGSLLKEIKKSTFWTPQVQRSSAIRSKITEKIREVLYQDNSYRKKFLNSIGEKIYKEWNPDKIEEWVRLTALGSGRQVGRSCFLLQTPISRILIDCGIDVSSTGKDKYPYLEAPELDLSTVDAIVLSHAHIDHSGLIPYLYKMGYRGPVYMTPPTRDIAALLALDFIGVAYKQAATPLFRSSDVRMMVKHSVCLNYHEVTDITPDVRITFYNAGHILGSAMIHFNIGNGLHNYLYTGDSKFGRSRLLDPAASHFPRLETLQVESTYGGKTNVAPPRREVEKQLIEYVNKIIGRGGKLLIPELGVGRAQETMLVLDEAMRLGKLPKVPIYIDGMIWDINALHTAYPDFLSNSIRASIFSDKNPFLSEIFKQVGSPQERKAVIEGGPCVILATSGMLAGGASVEYFRELADNEKNGIAFVCYQGAGSLGRQVQEGLKEATFNVEGKEERVEIKLEVATLEGFSAHSSRNELMAFVSNITPRPRKVIVNHGEQSKALDFASSIYRSYKIETVVPKNLETVRLR